MTLQLTSIRRGMCTDYLRRVRAGVMIWGLIRITSSVFAQGAVMILSSDASVEKYQVAQEAFIESLGRDPVLQVDLADNRSTEAQVIARMTNAAPAAVYCLGSRAYLLADRVVGDRKIVLSSAINWRRFEVGKNTLVVENELRAGTQLNHFRYFFPSLQSVGVVCSRQYNREWADEAVARGKDMELKVRCVFVDEDWEVSTRLRRLLSKVDALWVTADPIVLRDVDTVGAIFEEANKAKVPVFAYSGAFADFGCTLMVSPDAATIGRQAARLIEMNPEDLSKEARSQSPAGSHIILNLKAVRDLGLEIDPKALDSVNDLIR